MNTNNNHSLCKRIMRRVYFIWFAKKVAPYVLIELALFIGFLNLIGHNVFVSKVMQYAGQILANSSIDPMVWANFVLNTFLGTELIIQLAVLGSLAMMVLVFKNFITSLTQLALAREETKMVG